MVIPSKFVANILTDFKSESVKFSKNCNFVICSKGIENKSLKFVSDIIRSFYPSNNIAVLSGPNFAIEIAKSLPAITTLACEDKKIADSIIAILKNDQFHPYYSDDIISTQLCGALKNILAIAVGIATGSNASDSTKSAIITKGMNEMSEIIVAMGGSKESLMQPCAIGDVTLTCLSLKSRNMSLGYELGAGKTLQQILDNRSSIAEGVETSKAVNKIIKRHNLNCDIFTKLYRILHEGLDISKVSFI